MIQINSKYKTLSYQIASGVKATADVGVFGVGNLMFVPGGPMQLRNWDFENGTLDVFNTDSQIMAHFLYKDSTSQRIALLCNKV